MSLGSKRIYEFGGYAPNLLHTKHAVPCLWAKIPDMHPHREN